MPYRCLILDDEPIAREILEHYVQQIPELEVAASLGDPLAAMKRLREENIDLVLLDIQMPAVNGLQWLSSLDQAPAVIFTTAHREYALEGFELAAVDYLLKPIALPRFLKAINRFMEGRKKDVSVLRSSSPKSIFIRVNRRSVRLEIAQILWVEGLKDYLRIHTPTDKWVIKSTLTDFANRLPKADFVRIHRSYIVNRHQISAYDREEVVLPGQSLPLGRTYRQSFLQLMIKESK